MKKLMVLAAGLLQVPVIQKAREMGHYVIAVDGNPDACGFKYADKAICANIVSEEDILEVAKLERIDGVIHPCSEVSMNVMGRINDELQLHGVTREQAIIATNKHLMRKAFDKGGAPNPTSYMPTSCEDAWNYFCEMIDTAAILKPSRNSGSRGIAKIESGISRCCFEGLYNTALEESRDHSVLIEQYIEGPEFSVEIIVWNNVINVLAITDKKTTGAPHFVELGHNQPSCYPDDIIDVVKSAAISGVKSLGVNDCACHAEIKVQNKKAYIMEIGARMGGDFISTILTPLSTGIDMPAAAINCALGIEPNLLPMNSPKGVCVRYFTPSAGKFYKLDLSSLCFDERVHEYEIYIKSGDLINNTTSSSTRSGHVIVVDEDVHLAIKLADDIVNETTFYVE